MCKIEPRKHGADMDVKKADIELAQKVAMAYYRKKRPLNQSYNSLLSFAYLGLLYGLMKIDKRYGDVKRERYLVRRIWGTIIDEIRKDGFWTYRKEKVDYLPTIEILTDIIKDSTKKVDLELHYKDLVAKALNIAKDKSYRLHVIVSMMLEGHSQHDIAHKVGISACMVRKHLDYVRDKLYKRYGGEL